MNIKRFAARAVHGVQRRIGLVEPKQVPSFEGDASLEDREKSDLHRAFYGHTGPLIHKWTHYLSIYDRYFAAYRMRPVRMLEIGVSQGGSLSLWRKYFGPQAKLFGVDIDPRCAKFDGLDGQVRIGSQDDPAFLRSVVAEMGGVDIVLDDGSHVAEHQKVSFETLFPLISENGLYLCEDLHTSYWASFNGGYKRKGAFIEVAKAVTDDIHADFHEFETSVKDANRNIKCISFYNSMVVIEKEPQSRPNHVEVGDRSFSPYHS